MGAFFSFIFFFILVILFIGLILVLTVFNKVRDAFRQLKGQTPEQDNNTHINGNVVIISDSISRFRSNTYPLEEFVFYKPAEQNRHS